MIIKTRHSPGAVPSVSTTIPTTELAAAAWVSLSYDRNILSLRS
jgi:hypothetical protein